MCGCNTNAVSGTNKTWNPVRDGVQTLCEHCVRVTKQILVLNLSVALGASSDTSKLFILFVLFTLERLLSPMHNPTPNGGDSKLFTAQTNS